MGRPLAPRPPVASYSGVSNGGARDNHGIKQWLPAIGGVLIGAGVLSALYLYRNPYIIGQPRTLTIEADSPRDMEFGPTVYAKPASAEDDNDHHVRIDPHKRRWPLHEENEEVRNDPHKSRWPLREEEDEDHQVRIDPHKRRWPLHEENDQVRKDPHKSRWPLREEEDEDHQVRIDPHKRRWPTLEEELEEKRLREQKRQEEEKRKKQQFQDNIARAMAAMETLIKQNT